MKEYASGIIAGSKSNKYLPNSLCLHLIIETSDHKVVLSKISTGKRNDNPDTWAATLGEQLEADDFRNANNFYEDFVSGWVKRAFIEECGLSPEDYYAIVNEKSIRVLGVDFESDRYNFSLVCVVQVNYPFMDYYEKIKSTMDNNEAIELKGIDISEIPTYLVQYKNEKERKEYHPSTFLRLLLLYVHENGYSRAENKISDCIKKQMVKKCKQKPKWNNS